MPMPQLETIPQAFYSIFFPHTMVLTAKKCFLEKQNENINKFCIPFFFFFWPWLHDLL